MPPYTAMQWMKQEWRRFPKDGETRHVTLSDADEIEVEEVSDAGEVFRITSSNVKEIEELRSQSDGIALLRLSTPDSPEVPWDGGHRCTEMLRQRPVTIELATLKLVVTLKVLDRVPAHDLRGVRSCLIMVDHRPRISDWQKALGLDASHLDFSGCTYVDELFATPGGAQYLRKLKATGKLDTGLETQLQKALQHGRGLSQTPWENFVTKSCPGCGRLIGRLLPGDDGKTCGQCRVHKSHP